MTINKNQHLAPKICSVYFEKIKGVATIGDGADKYHKTVTFKSGFGWKQIYFTPGSIQFEEPEANSAAGTAFNQKLTASFPGDDVSNYTDFDNYASYRYIVKMVYDNGTVKTFGDQFNPATMKKEDSTAKGGSTITFYRTGTDKAYILS